MPFLKINDLRLHHRVLGAGETLVLIHGLGSSGADWAFQAKPLAEHFRLVIPDLRGSGLSDAPRGPYAISQFADDLWCLLDMLGEQRVHLMGFSLGGAVALEMAVQRPLSIGRIMTINSLPTYRLDSWRKRWELYAQIALVQGIGLKGASRLAARRLFREPHQAAMRQRVIDVVGSSPRRPYMDTIRALAGWCALDRMPALGANLLMLAGEYDYTPLAEKLAYAERFGAGFKVVRGSRHGTPFDASNACNACALSFFRGLELPPAAMLEIDPPEFAPMTASAGL
jgi:pimeloyl-ACP methyl ester carboxylesterase